MKSSIKFINLLIVLLLFISCEGREEIFKKPLSVKGAFPLYDRILFVNETLKDLVTIKFSEMENVSFEIFHSPFEGVFSKYRISANGKILYALDQKNKKFFIYETEKGGFKEVSLQTGFTDWTISEDEAFVLFYFSTKEKFSSQEILTNTSQVSLLNLKKDIDEKNPWVKAIRSTGEIPDNIIISPMFKIGGKEQRIALVELKSHIFIIDLMEKADKEISIPLIPPDSEYILSPIKSKFYIDGETLILYLLTTNSQDIFEIKFQYNAGGEGSEESNFTPVINQFASGVNPVDVISFIGKDGNRKILSLNSVSKDVAYIDSKTGIKISIPLDFPAQKIVYFEEKAGEKQGKYALLYSSAYGNFYILNLNTVEEKKGKALAKKITKKPIKEIIHFNKKNLFLLFFYHEEFEEGLSIYDFNKDNFISFGFSGNINSYLIPQEDNRLFLTGNYNYGWTSYLSILSMQNFLSKSVFIDKEANYLYYIPVSKKIVLDHAKPYGDITVFDERRLDRKEGLRIKGFIFDEILEK